MRQNIPKLPLNSVRMPRAPRRPAANSIRSRRCDGVDGARLSTGAFYARRPASRRAGAMVKIKVLSRNTDDYVRQ